MHPNRTFLSVQCIHSISFDGEKSAFRPVFPVKSNNRWEKKIPCQKYRRHFSSRVVEEHTSRYSRIARYRLSNDLRHRSAILRPLVTITYRVISSVRTGGYEITIFPVVRESLSGRATGILFSGIGHPKRGSMDGDVLAERRKIGRGEREARKKSRVEIAKCHVALIN